MRCIRSIVPGICLILGLFAATPLAMAQAPAASATAPEAKAGAAWKTIEDRWYIMEINGAKAGWMNTLIETDGSKFRTRSDTSMKVGRVGASVEISMTSIFTETADNKPLLIEFNQKMATQAVESKWEFVDGKVRFTSKQGGKETTQELNPPGEVWMTPMAADAYAKKQRAESVHEFTIKTVDPQNGIKPVTSTSTLVGERNIRGEDEKLVKVVLWKTRTTLMPIDALEQYTPDNVMIRQEVPTGVGKIVTRLSTKAIATGDAAADGPELLTQTFIKPDKPIDNPLKTTAAKLKLTVKDGEMPVLPTAGAQKFVIGPDGKSAELVIDINNNQPASSEDTSNKEYIEPSTMIDSKDELVQSLAAKAVKDAGADPMAKAQACRTFVNTYISKKGMATAFASASETAKNRTGDCSEHGVLLAALLRANGIPARVTTGLLYVENFGGEKGIFGWHMWTQGLIDGKWVDLDAVLPNRYNAMHILASTSSLSLGLGAEDMSPVLLLIGNLDITVEDVGYGKQAEKHD